MINNNQSKDLIFKIMNSIGSPDLFDHELYTWSWNERSMTSSKFRRWRVRSIPGNCFIFNGKERISHTFIFPKYENEYLGTIYRRGLGSDYLYFFRSEEKTREILHIKSKEWLIDCTWRNTMVLYPESSEELKNEFYSQVSADLENSLEICNEEDIVEFNRTLDLIHIRNV